jgi:hypothetical protein
MAAGRLRAVKVLRDTFKFSRGQETTLDKAKLSLFRRAKHFPPSFVNVFNVAHTQLCSTGHLLLILRSSQQGWNSLGSFLPDEVQEVQPVSRVFRSPQTASCRGFSTGRRGKGLQGVIPIVSITLTHYFRTDTAHQLWLPQKTTPTRST